MDSNFTGDGGDGGEGRDFRIYIDKIDNDELIE